MYFNKFMPLPPVRRGLLTAGYREYAARRTIDREWDLRANRLVQDRGRQPGLYVSLTSYAPRFATLVLTLKSLLLQDLRPEAVLLWIGHADMPFLPDEVRELAPFGLRILPCEDFGPHTKYTHALRHLPHAKIAICDDDTYYPPHWLAGLVAGDRPGEIACRRIHRVALDMFGEPLGYRWWDHDTDLRDPSRLNFPTGVGGVLLRLDRLDPMVLDIELARRLCPTTDDIWLYAMGRLAGTRFRLVGGHEPLTVWRTSQFSALWRTNVLEHGNDAHLQAVFDHFGMDRLLGDPVALAA